MADLRWSWSATSRRYRDTDTGRFLPAATVVKLRDDLVDARARAIATATDELAAETRTVDSWLGTMRAEVKTLTVAEYTFGRGGKNALTPADYGRIGALVKAQYRYLDEFARAIAAGELSPAQVAARAGLYARAATAAHGRGLAAAWGIVLPQVPGDGKTICLTNCRCHLDIFETADTVEVRWVIDAQAEHCDDCKRLAREWTPLVIAKKEAA